MLTRIQKELADLGSIMQDGKHLKDAVGKLCKKYVKHGIARGAAAAGGTSYSHDEDSESKEALQEILKQKSFLERAVASLKVQMKKQGTNHRQVIETIKKLLGSGLI